MDWRAWLETYGSRLYAYANGLDANEADDLVQKALMGAVKAVRDGRLNTNGDDILRYAYTSIRNAAYRHFSNRDRRGRLDYAWSAEQPWLGGAEDAERTLLCRCVESAMQKLPPAYAEVVFLHLWGGQSFRVIGDILGEAPTTVSSRYLYAITLIRKHLNQS